MLLDMDLSNEITSEWYFWSIYVGTAWGIIALLKSNHDSDLNLTLL